MLNILFTFDQYDITYETISIYIYMYIYYTYSVQVIYKANGL